MPTRIVFMGMPCEFSRIIFRALSDAGLLIVGLIIPSPHPAARTTRWQPPPSGVVLWPKTLTSAAHARNVPVLEVGPLRSPESLAALETLEPDLICAACFPRLLPPAWLAHPRMGCLNLHPSLLPAYRGPEPLFWQFQAGERRTGITLHFMDAGADTGDIVAQAPVPVADGIRGAEAERLMAEAGAQLLLEALSKPALPRQPQPASGASYAPRPTAADLVITADWEARRAFNFIRGAREWGPFEVRMAARRYHVSDAEAIAARASALPPSNDLAVSLPFAFGAVRLRLARG